MTATTWAAVVLLGGIGALGRFLVDARVAAIAGRAFPLGTLAINLSGSFVLGILVGATLEGNGYVLAGTATIGSYTTFSTWMYETQRLTEDGQVRGAALNVGVSLGLGLAAAALGRAIGELL
ncbi:MAG TPA: fluoride efflux transporter CrcB [Solirubrobacteraceae bacterium]|nr:fluoride efflux transporter CrcB [Solirubrobacteraceae bacterium]